MQDTLLGARLMTSRDCFIEKDLMFNILLNLEVRVGVMMMRRSGGQECVFVGVLLAVLAVCVCVQFVAA